MCYHIVQYFLGIVLPYLYFCPNFLSWLNELPILLLHNSFGLEIDYPVLELEATLAIGSYLKARFLSVSVYQIFALLPYPIPYCYIFYHIFLYSRVGPGTGCGLLEM